MSFFGVGVIGAGHMLSTLATVLFGGLATASEGGQ